MHENQESINKWQNEQFPDATEEGVRRHLVEEFWEFRAADGLKALVEAADIVILLYAWANKRGYDLHKAIDEKMKVNRDRNWNIQPDGTGRHT